jgi:hypothetical protein
MKNLNYEEMQKDPEYVAYMARCREAREELAKKEGLTYDEYCNKQYKQFLNLVYGTSQEKE